MRTSDSDIISPSKSPIRSITSRHGAGTVNYINSRENTDPDDLLADIGYQAQLNRRYNAFETFGITMSIMGLMSSIASTAGIGLSGGPSSFVWGWLIGGFFILNIGYCIGELCSSLPASSGPYLWTYYYAPQNLKKPLSFMIGWSNSMALAGGVCSITYGLSVQIFSAIFIGKDGDFDITDGKQYGLFVGLVIVQLTISCLPSKFVSRLQALSVVSNNVLIVIFLVALPVGTYKSSSASFRDAKFIFTKFENESGWTNGWAFLLFGLMPSIWTMGALDASVHMAEEVKNPVKAVPLGVIGSISACWITGWVICIVICACMSEDIASITGSASGQPLAQIFYDSLGKEWAIAFISLCAYCQFLMGISIMTSLSRQIWAFARDDGLPFSEHLKKVHEGTKIPVNAVVFSGIASCVLGLLILIGTTAANALFSITIIGNYISWSIPSLVKTTSGRDVFTPGPFYAGKTLSFIINVAAISFQFFAIILAMFPDSTTVETKTMNYAVVINVGIWILSIVYYYIFKKDIYVGPKSDLDQQIAADSIAEPNLDKILDEKLSSS